MFKFDLDGLILTVTKEAIANFVEKEPYFGGEPDSAIAVNIANRTLMTVDVGSGKWVATNVDCTSYRWYNEYGVVEEAEVEAEKELYW